MCWRACVAPTLLQYHYEERLNTAFAAVLSNVLGGNKRPPFLLFCFWPIACVLRADHWLSLGGRQWEPRILTPRLLYLQSCALRGAEVSWTHRSKISRWIHKQLSCLLCGWITPRTKITAHKAKMPPIGHLLLYDGAVKHICERSGGKRCYSRLLHRACLGEAMFDFKCHI